MHSHSFRNILFIDWITEKILAKLIDDDPAIDLILVDPVLVWHSETLDLLMVDSFDKIF